MLNLFTIFIMNNYRKEIDGLRALAIIPVVLFHTGSSFFEGGYVGVDIFFVISGYLITKLIIKDYLDRTFTIAKFYERRIRRIIPALFFMIMVITFISYFVMSPSDLKNFYKSSLSNTLFLSNFFFWKNINYFSNPTELIPLIHLWSISIEEQFYLIFPLIFLILLKKTKINQIFFLLISLSVFSLLFAQIIGNFNLVKPYIEKNFSFFYISSASFYLPFSRAWELLIGCAIALFMHKKKQIEFHYSNIIVLFGISLILFSIFFYDKNIPYASIYTLVPVLGSSILIIFLNKKNFFYNLFTYKYLIFVGLISYSLYLWHQPIFALYRLYFIDEPTWYEYFFLIILSIMISIFSWKFIETPFRNKYFLSRGKILTIFLIFSLSIISINIIGLNTNGFNKIKVIEQKLGPKKNIILKKQISITHMINLQKKYLINDLEIFKNSNGKNKILFIGDSHARDLYVSSKLNSKYTNNIDFFKLTLGNNCLSFLEDKKGFRKLECEKELNYIIKNSNLIKKADYIIFSMRHYKDPTFQLSKLISRLNIENEKVILAGSRNEFYRPVNLALKLVMKNKDTEYSERKLFINRKKHTDEYNKKIKKLSEIQKFKFIDMFEIACNRKYKKCDFFDNDYNLYYYDYGHWTIQGAEIFGIKFIKKLDLILND